MAHGDEILVISHTHDAHALDVLGRLEQRGMRPVLFDTGRIPRETTLTITHDTHWGGQAMTDGRAIDLAAVRAVWWRRPQPFGLHNEVGGAEDRAFAASETHAAVSGLWSLLDATWINDPDADERAGRKAFQLKVAAASGLSVPRSCITTDPDEARRFVAGIDGPVIYKAFSATERTWRETRRLKPEEMDGLDAVRFAPVIFQEFIPAAADLRVTIVGDRCFPAAIRSREGAYAFDFRVAMDDVDIAPHVLPPDIEQALHDVMARLGLVYGAFDLRLTPEGEYVFLEVNPAGQWLFVERQTGQPISEAIAERLASAAGVH